MRKHNSPVLARPCSSTNPAPRVGMFLGALLPVGQYGLFGALLPVGQYGLCDALLPVGQYGLCGALDAVGAQIGKKREPVLSASEIGRQVSPY